MVILLSSEKIIEQESVVISNPVEARDKTLRPSSSRGASCRTVGAGADTAGGPPLSVHAVKIIVIWIMIVLIMLGTGGSEDRLHQVRGQLGGQDHGGGLDGLPDQGVQGEHPVGLDGVLPQNTVHRILVNK